jgi:hypothetical protein
MKYVGDKIHYLLKEPREDSFTLRIPTYHRAAIGLFPGTRVFFVPISSRRELIVTPIRPSKWGDLWKLEVDLKDIPGAVRSILESCSNHKVNILVQESLSDRPDISESDSAHRLSLILDLFRYESAIDGGTGDRGNDERSNGVPNYLINQLINRSSEFIRLNRDRDRWAFDLRRMRYFYEYRRHRTDGWESNLIGHSLQIPMNLLNDKIYLGRLPNPIACHLISDTEEKYLKIKFLHPQDKYMLISMEHREEIGAIHRFAEIIAGRNINILNSYSRISAMDKLAFWNCFLQVPDGLKMDDMVALLHELDGEQSMLKFAINGHYGFNFDFAKAVQDSQGLTKFDRTTLKRRPKPTRLPEVSTKAVFSATEKRLDLKPFYLGKKWNRDNNSVFVAMPFDQLYEEFYNMHVASVLLKNGLKPVRMDKIPVGDPNRNIMEAVQENIAVCEFMVADVTTKNANVLYEMGLAHAIGRKVLIICQANNAKVAGQDALFDINGKPHVFYSMFKLDEFDKQLDACIKAIRAARA